MIPVLIISIYRESMKHVRKHVQIKLKKIPIKITFEILLIMKLKNNNITY